MNNEQHHAPRAGRVEQKTPGGMAAGGAHGPRAGAAIAGPAEPAWRSPGAWALLLAIVVVGAAVDLVSKQIAFDRVAAGPVQVLRDRVLAMPAARINELIPGHTPVTAVPGVLEFQLVLNPGAVFGVGAGKRSFFVAFTIATTAMALWCFGVWTTKRDRAVHVGIGLILSGGIGNLYDRVVHGCVRDFLLPLPGWKLPFGLAWPGGERGLWPWVSNVADAALVVGVAVVLLAAWREPPGKTMAGTAGENDGPT